MKIHVIEKGEQLWQLSRRFGTPLNQLAAVNALSNPNALVIGQALIITDPAREYVVLPGDQLSAIAQRYRVSVQELMQFNHLTSNTIYPGEVLYIPIHHTVKAGETLGGIARQYGTTVQAIAQLNQITDPALLYVGQVLRIPEKTKPLIDVNAFTDQFGEKAAQEVRQLGRDLTYLSPFGYRMKDDGSLEPINDAPVLQAAKSVQIVPMMAITNFSSTEPGSQLAHTILSSTALQDKLLTNTINTMKAKGYRGLNIDFENVRQTDREAYNRFLQRAVDRLHPEGYFVSSSLAPKTSANQQGLLYEAHDYAAHGRILDFVVLMTYEWGCRVCPPQAVSPINQIRAVLDYAVTVIPRNKILMGFQLYARDWVLPHQQGMQAETYSMQEAVRRAVQHGSTIQYEAKSQSPFFRYADEQGRTHEVWFEDARSAQAKFSLAKEYKLRGISYWVLGYPFPQNWVLLHDNFRVRKIK